MYTPYTFIDAVQTAKQNFVESYIKDPALKETANKYIDTQTAFCKTAVDAAFALARYVNTYTWETARSFANSAKEYTEEKAQAKASRKTK